LTASLPARDAADRLPTIDDVADAIDPANQDRGPVRHRQPDGHEERPAEVEVRDRHRVLDLLRVRREGPDHELLLVVGGDALDLPTRARRALARGPRKPQIEADLILDANREAALGTDGPFRRGVEEIALCAEAALAAGAAILLQLGGDDVQRAIVVVAGVAAAVAVEIFLPGVGDGRTIVVRRTDAVTIGVAAA